MPGQIVLYRPADELVIAGSEGVGLTIRQVAFPAADWDTFATFMGLDPTWATANEPPIASLDPGDVSVERPFEVAMKKLLDSPRLSDLVQFWIALIPTLFPNPSAANQRAEAPVWLVNSLAAMREEQNLRGGVPRLVELAHVRPSHLIVTTRRYFGKTPTALMADLRLRHAAVRLSRTTDSMGTIATRCGFGKLSIFSSSFSHEVPAVAARVQASFVETARWTLSFVGYRKIVT